MKSYEQNKESADEWWIRHHKVIETQDRLVKSYLHFPPPNRLSFFMALTITLEVYILPNSTLFLRFINHPSLVGQLQLHSYIMCPISIFVDDLVKPSIAKPMLLCDSHKLMQYLETVQLPVNYFLATAVSSLYPNIDTKDIIALDLCSERSRCPRLHFSST